MLRQPASKPGRRAAARLLAGLLMPALGLFAAAAAQARTRPHYGGTLRIEVEAGPLQGLSGTAPGLVRTLVLDGLTSLDQRGDPQPSLAERWSSENDDHRWQFRLRSGVLFHDGKPLTAISVAASLAESCRIAPCPWSGVHAVGSALIFTSETAIPGLPATLAEDRFRIQSASPSFSDNPSGPDSASHDFSGQNASPLIGTGPFRIAPAHNAPAGTLLLEANDECWQGRPFLDAIQLTVRQPGHDGWNDLNPAAGLHGTDMIALRPGEAREAAQRRITVAQQPAVFLLALEVRESSLNPQLRAALALAIDRSAIQQVIFQKQGEVTGSLLPAAVSGYSFLFPTERNLASAQAQRGGLTPPPLTIATEDSEAMQLAAAHIALNMHDAGFNVRLLPALHDGRIANADLTLRLIPVTSGDPAAALDAMLPSFGQPAALRPGDTTAAYRAEREFLLRHAVIPLLYLPRLWAVSPRVRDLRLTFDGMPDLANASLGDAP